MQCKKNVLTIGDAAGHVMAINGGGIQTAMICGRICGNVMAKYLNGESTLYEYDVKWREVIGKELQNALKLRKLIDYSSMKSDIIGSLMMYMMGGERLGDLLRCKSIRSIIL